MNLDTAIIIPARIASVRLPNKMLLDINGETLIQRVAKIAINAKIGEVYIATDSIDIKHEIESKFKDNINVVLVSEYCASGTDRINLALKKINRKFDYIVNLQGDMPNIDIEIIKTTLQILKDKKDCEIATIVSPFKIEADINNPSNVKCAFSFNDNSNIYNAIYFSRSKIPANADIFYKHIGIYGYTTESLEKFCKLEVSFLERTEKLEQLRALENKMSIYVSIYNSEKDLVSIDTKEDLEFARKIIL